LFKNRYKIDLIDQVLLRISKKNILKNIIYI